MQAISPRQPARHSAGFTVIEVMLAIGMFAMILTVIYAMWMAILKGTRIGTAAAANVQRERVAMRTLEDAFLTVQLFAVNMREYLFIADTSGDFAAVSFVSRLPASFPGVGRYGDLVVRRVSFTTRPDSKNGNELVMTQYPVLADTNATPPYSLVLAQDVSLFKLAFYDDRKGEWLDEWRYTNQLPRLVQVALGMGRVGGGYGAKPQDVVSRLVAIPATAVAGDIQGAGPQPAGGPIGPGGIPPGGVPPGSIPPGTIPPGTFPGGNRGNFGPGYTPGFGPQPINPGIRR